MELSLEQALGGIRYHLEDRGWSSEPPEGERPEGLYHEMFGCAVGVWLMVEDESSALSAMVEIGLIAGCPDVVNYLLFPVTAMGTYEGSEKLVDWVEGEIKRAVELYAYDSFGGVSGTPDHE